MKQVITAITLALMIVTVTLATNKATVKSSDTITSMFGKPPTTIDMWAVRF